MIPRSYEEWRLCITRDCGIPLTLAFAKTRLAIYQNTALPETRKFAKLYGEDHLANVVLWLRQEVANQSA